MMMMMINNMNLVHWPLMGGRPTRQARDVCCVYVLLFYYVSAFLFRILVYISSAVRLALAASLQLYASCTTRNDGNDAVLWRRKWSGRVLYGSMRWWFSDAVSVLCVATSCNSSRLAATSGVLSFVMSPPRLSRPVYRVAAPYSHQSLARWSTRLCRYLHLAGATSSVNVQLAVFTPSWPTKGLSLDSDPGDGRRRWSWCPFLHLLEWTEMTMLR